MTTIATDGKTMAADTQCGGECFHTEFSKLYRASDGAMLGYCGQAADKAGFNDWYENGGEGKPDVSDDFEGLILLPDGRVMCVDKRGSPFFHGVPASIGSGCRFAYGAMDAGASPSEAIAIAMKRDAYTGGTVEVETVNKIRAVA